MMRAYFFLLLLIVGLIACGEQANTKQISSADHIALQIKDDGVLRLANPIVSETPIIKAAQQKAGFLGQLPSDANSAETPISKKIAPTTKTEVASATESGAMNEAMEVKVAASISKYLKNKTKLLGSVNTNYESEAYKKLKKFYSARGSRAVWTNFKRIDSYIGALRRATRHGLNPEHYGLSKVVAVICYMVASALLKIGKLFGASETSYNC